MAPNLLLTFFLIIASHAQINYNPDTEVEIGIDDNPNSYIFHIGDFNGDGKDDYLRQKIGEWADQTNTAVELFLAKNNKKFQKFVLGADFELYSNNINLYVGDFNGDGKDDILRQEKGDWAADQSQTAIVMMSNDKGGFTCYDLPESLQLNGDFSNLYIGDFNGDGKADIFRQTKGDYAEQPACVLIAIDDKKYFFASVELPLDYGLNGDLTNLYVGDFNGDGLDDVLRQEKGDYAKDRVNTAYLLIAKEDYSFEKIVLSEDYDLNGDLTTLNVADFNGDGRADILRREKGAWATDNKRSAELLICGDEEGKFETITLSEDFNLKADNTNVYLGDFNGDKKYDFLRQITGEIDSGATRTEVFMSTGDNFEGFPFIEEKNDLEGMFYVGDFNGDKRDDLLRFVSVDEIRVFYSNGDGSYV